MAKRKSIMAVPTKWGQQERLFGETVKEGLDVLLGHRGSPFQRAVTFQDLLDTNVLKLAPNVKPSIAGGNPSDFEVPSEDANIQIPPAPTGLSASGAFQNIILTWDLKTYVGHAFVEIHRHTSDSISDATLLARVSGFTGIYADAVGTNANYYYWVRAVNINDDLGPFNSSTGVNGTTQPDVDVILDLLEEQITTSELATSLATQISDIDSLTGNLETFTGYLDTYSGSDLITRIGGLDTSIGSINSSITTINSSITSLNTATSNLQTSLSDLSANTADVYISASEPTGTAQDPIADNSRWYDTSDNNTLHIYFDSDGDGTKEWVSVEDPRIAQNESSVSSLNAEVFNADNTSRLATSSALATTNSTVSSLNGTVSSLSTDVTALEGAVFDADSNVKLATVSALNSLISDVQSIYDEDDNTSLLRVVQADVSSLKSTVFDSNNNVLLATTAVTTSLRNDIDTIYDADDANSLVRVIQSDITDLESDVYDADNNVKLATTTALAGLRNEVEAIYDADNDQSLVRVLQSDVTTLNSTVFDSDNNVVLATTSALSGLSSTVDTIYSADDADSLVRVLQSDVTSLNSQVFNSDNSARLATASALEGVESNVSAIYDADDETSIVRVLQSDVTSLEGAVFDENNNVKLATATALGGLQSEVEAIYDGEGNASLINTIQSDISSLDAAVFDADNNVKLASGSALSGLQNEVRAIYNSESDDTIVGSVQSDITTLNGAVFDADNNVQLASASAVSALNNEVWGDGVTPSSATSSRIDALNATLTDPDTGLEAVSDAVDVVTTAVYPNGVSNASAITTLNSAVFDSTNQVKLASASALNALETEVYGTGGASASRIDGIISTLYDDGELAFASATAFNNLNTAVTGEGAIADKVDNIAAQMFVDGDTEGTLNLATAANLQTVTAEVFPNGATNASRLDQLSSAVWSGGNPDNDLILASADIVDDLETAVFPNGSAQASSISTLQVQVQGEDGSSGALGSIETLQQVVGDENGGLSSQYSVKLDNNGHVAGFGLSNTDNDGTPTSAFIIRADKFALVNPSATNEQTNSPANSTDLIVPFTVQATAVLDDDGATIVPAGVYMDTAFIRKGSITNAFIQDATIDYAKIASVNADTITTGEINTSLLNIDGTTLTSDPITGALRVDEINANQITAGNISATVMSGTTVYADNLEGDVNTLKAFRDTTAQYFRGGAYTGSQGGLLTFLEAQLPASTHDDGHIPYSQASGWFYSTSNKTYTIKMLMKDNSTSNTNLGNPSAAGTQYAGKGSTVPYVEFSGDLRTQIMIGHILTASGKQATVSSATYNGTSTRILYSVTSGSAFSTSDTVYVRPSGNFQDVGEFRIKANTGLYVPFTISGTLGVAVTGTVDMKLTMFRTGSSGVTDNDTSSAQDIINEVTGIFIGQR